MHENNPLLKTLVKQLDDAKAIDVVVMDVSDQTAITDFMVIATGRASRHVQAIANQLLEQMKKAGLPALSATGLDSGDWALIDFGYFVVHIMQPDSRAFYNLEGLWQQQSI